MIFEGVSWNDEDVITYSEDQFIREGIQIGYYKQYSIDDQRQLLKEVYERSLKNAGGVKATGNNK